MSNENKKSGRTPEGWKNIEGHQWPKGVSGNPKGRPKSRVTALLEGCLTKKQIQENTNLSSEEIDAIEKIVLSLDLKSLQAIAKADATPAYMKTLAMAAILDMKNGKTRVMDLLRDRQFGAVKKQVDVTTNGMSMAAQSMTPNEAREALKKIEEEY
jgi:hypothetical protein